MVYRIYIYIIPTKLNSIIPLYPKQPGFFLNCATSAVFGRFGPRAEARQRRSIMRPRSGESRPGGRFSWSRGFVKSGSVHFDLPKKEGKWHPLRILGEHYENHNFWNQYCQGYLSSRRICHHSFMRMFDKTEGRVDLNHDINNQMSAFHRRWSHGSAFCLHLLGSELKEYWYSFFCNLDKSLLQVGSDLQLNSVSIRSS